MKYTVTFEMDEELTSCYYCPLYDHDDLECRIQRGKSESEAYATCPLVSKEDV